MSGDGVARAGLGVGPVGGLELGCTGAAARTDGDGEGDYVSVAVVAGVLWITGQEPD